MPSGRRAVLDVRQTRVHEPDHNACCAVRRDVAIPDRSLSNPGAATNLMLSPLPVEKLPQELLAALLSRAPVDDPRLTFGPGCHG